MKSSEIAQIASRGVLVPWVVRLVHLVRLVYLIHPSGRPNLLALGEYIECLVRKRVVLIVHETETETEADRVPIRGGW